MDGCRCRSDRCAAGWCVVLCWLAKSIIIPYCLPKAGGGWADGVCCAAVSRWMDGWMDNRLVGWWMVDLVSDDPIDRCAPLMSVYVHVCMNLTCDRAISP